MADPVSIFVNPIVTNIIYTAASLIQDKFLAINGVKEEVEKLSSNLITIRAVLKDAEQKQLNPAFDTLRVWLAKLKDAACDAEDILNTFVTETFLWKRKQQVRRIKTQISLSKVRYKSSVTHEIKEISAKLDKIAEKKGKFPLVECSDGGRPQNLPQTTPFVDTRDVFSRDSDKERLIAQMLSNESDAEGDVSVIPIIRMGGLGKTTLAQLIFNDERVKNHFMFRMWVYVTVASISKGYLRK
ncbi:hypothetical protein CRYUN_Cryun16bG0043800 [Craigia yunnanensis]